MTATEVFHFVPFQFGMTKPGNGAAINGPIGADPSLDENGLGFNGLK
jgi:hypothetical protein